MAHSSSSTQSCKLPILDRHVHSSRASFLISPVGKSLGTTTTNLFVSLDQRKQSRLLTRRATTGAGAGAATTVSEDGEPISLGTAKLPMNIDLNLLEGLLFQWANSLTQNANFMLELPLKVDKLKGGVRLAYIRINEGVVENLVHIDVLLLPSTDASSQPLFLAQRSGKLKNSVPPGEPAIMQSLLQALKTSVKIATKD